MNSAHNSLTPVGSSTPYVPATSMLPALEILIQAI